MGWSSWAIQRSLVDRKANWKVRFTSHLGILVVQYVRGTTTTLLGIGQVTEVSSPVVSQGKLGVQMTPQLIDHELSSPCIIERLVPSPLLDRASATHPTAVIS